MFDSAEKEFQEGKQFEISNMLTYCGNHMEKGILPN